MRDLIGMYYSFIVGNLYRRRDVYRVIGIPEDTKGGNWDTGYARHNDDWFIFANIGIPGRTGHDYANEWIGPNLLWYGKTNTNLRQPAIRSMLTGTGEVYIFVRSDQRAPFVFVGCGKAEAVKETSPVTVLWSLSEPQQNPVAMQPLLYQHQPQRRMDDLVRESWTNAVYTARTSQDEVFEAANIEDARKRIMASIMRRQGQPGFRYTLLSAYEGQCSFSRTNVPEALEAAHIVPYRGQQTNHPANGLLLRADIHTLFDLGRIAVDADKMTVLVSPSLIQTDYETLAGQRLVLPKERTLHPDRQALNQHRLWTGL